MDTKNLIKKTMTLLMIAIVSTGAIFAKSVTPKQNDKGKWGMVDNTGKWVAKAEYTTIEPYKDGYYLMQKDGKWGLIRPDGKKALDCKYKHEMLSAVGYIFAQEADNSSKWQAWDKLADSGNKTSLKNVSIKHVNDTIQIISGEIGSSYISIENSKKYIQSIVDLRRNGGQFSFLTTKGGIAISGVSSAKHLVGDIYACSHQRGCDIYDLSTGKYIASVNSSALSQPMPTDQTLLVLPVDYYNNKYLSNTGKIYKDTLNRFDWQENRLIADGKGKYGLVDKTGRNIIIPVEYDAIICDQGNYKRIENGSISNNDNYYLRKGSLWGIYASVNNSLKMLTECIYPYCVEDGQKHIPFKYLTYCENQNQPWDACFVVMSNGKAGILDNFGKEIVPCKYDGGGFSDNPRLGYLYDNGKTITYNPLDKGTTTRKYSNYKRFIGAKSYYRVEQNGKFGVVDDKDNLILPIKYSQITEAITSDNGHLDDAFHVWDADGRIGVAKVINGKGKEIVPCAGNYDRIWGYEPYGIIVIKNGKQGCIKENGATFCRPVYDGHINGLKRIGFIKNSATSNDVTVDIYDYNGKYLTTVNVGSSYLDQRWFVQKYLM